MAPKNPTTHIGITTNTVMTARLLCRLRLAVLSSRMAAWICACVALVSFIAYPFREAKSWK